MNTRTRLCLLPLLAALLQPAAVSAQEAAPAPTDEAQEEQRQWYTVEVILFAETEPQVSAEFWPAAPGLAPLDDTVVLRSPQGSGRPVPFQRLTATQMELGGARRRLERSQHHHPLLHTGWLQPGLGEAEAIPVHIRLPYDRELVRLDGQGRRTGPASPVSPFMDPVAPPPLLDGTLRLVLSRYLHLEADIVYRPALDGEPPHWNAPQESEAAWEGETAADTAPQAEGDMEAEPRRGLVLEAPIVTPAAPGPEPEPPTPRWMTADGRVVWPFRMEQRRRMRSEELHHLDHPAFGIITIVRPYEMPEVPPAPAGEQPPQADTEEAASDDTAPEDPDGPPESGDIPTT